MIDSNLVDKVSIPELVKALRCCGNVNTDCTVCPWDKYNFGMCAEKLYTDAAAAIEELQARLGEAENSVERWKDMYLTKHEPKMEVQE